jgi:hypothetical protein
MPSRRSTTGNYSLPPFRPSARSRVPTLPSADFCGAVREDGSPLSPCQDTPQTSRGKLSYLPCIGARFIKHSPFVDGLFTHKERLGCAAGAALLTQVSPVAWQHINLCGRYEFTKGPERINISAIVEALAQAPVPQDLAR